MKAWLTVRSWVARALSALGIVGVVAIAVGSLFAAGEIRSGLRAACSSRDAGWLTRRACDLFNVVPTLTDKPVELQDTDEAERADRHVAGEGETGQGLEILDLKQKDLAELERLLGRDLDGDGQVGRVTPRSERPPLESFGAGELLFVDKQVPRAPRGGRVVGTAPAAGGAVRVDLIPGEVPGSEWLHQVEYRLSGDLPVNGHELGDGLELSARWTPRRQGWVYLDGELWGAQLSEVEQQIFGKEYDWGVRAGLSLKCRGLFRCRPE